MSTKINRPQYIIIHHSYSPDNNEAYDWEAIKKYHTSYRYKDQSISAQKAKALMAEGKDVIPPWSDIGYHYGIEYDNGKIITCKGRDELTPGAHCKENGMNSHSIGICVVGRYDTQPPNQERMKLLVNLCADICERYRIPVENIRPHSEFARYKTCPGTAFNMEELKARVSAKLEGCA